MIQTAQDFQYAEYRGAWPQEEEEHVERILQDLEQDTSMTPEGNLPPWVCLRVRIPSWGLMYLAMRWNSSRLVRAKSLRGLLHALRGLTSSDFMREAGPEADSFDPAQWAMSFSEHSRAA